MTTSCGEGRYWISSLRTSPFKMGMEISSLTDGSAEVNIGICTACIPTLLPLYRLLRDRFNGKRPSEHSSQSPRAFTRMLMGRRRSSKKTSSQGSLFRTHVRNNISGPLNIETPHTTPSRFGRSEDLEMKTMSSQSLSNIQRQPPLPMSPKNHRSRHPTHQRDETSSPSDLGKDIELGVSRVNGSHRTQSSGGITSSPTDNKHHTTTTGPAGTFELAANSSGAPTARTVGPTHGNRPRNVDVRRNKHRDGYQRKDTM